MEEELEKECPRVMKYLKKSQLTTELFTMDWMYTLFSRLFHIKVVRVLWDLILVFGNYTVIKISLGLFRIFEEEIVLKGLEDGFNFFKSHCEYLEVSTLVKLALNGDFLDEDKFQKNITKKIFEDLEIEELPFY